MTMHLMTKELLLLAILSNAVWMSAMLLAGSSSLFKISSLKVLTEDSLRLHNPGTIVLLVLYNQHPGYENDLRICLAEVFPKYGDEVPFYRLDLTYRKDEYRLKYHKVVETIDPFGGVVISRVANRRGELTAIKTINLHDCSTSKLEVAITAHTSNETVQMDKRGFQSEVFKTGGRIRPYLVLFYADWNENILSYMKAFHRTAADFSELGANVIAASLDINLYGSVLHENLPEYNPKRFPFILYFYPIRRQQTVIEYIQFDGDLPTPLNMIEFLNRLDHHLMDTEGKEIDYRPWGSVIFETSSLAEGPLGYECLLTSSNLTDSEPKIWPSLHPPRVLVITPEKPTRDWFDFKLVGLEETKRKLERSNTGIPILTESSWVDVIERSHSHSHPFGRVEEHATQVFIVIFIKAECDFCQKSSVTFEQLHDNVQKIADQAHVYLVNCTGSKKLCEEQVVSGYPSIVAYRSISWLHHYSCLSEETASQLKYARHDYHGLIRVEDVMHWVNNVVLPAVQLLKTDKEKKAFHHLDTDSHLLATVIPKNSRHIPVRKLVSKGDSERVPYECYRLMCEKLFGLVSCAVEYHYKLTQAERDSTELSATYIYQIVLHRRDGLQNVVMEMDRSFHRILTSESETKSHSLHPPHRYKFTATQTCEDDHSFCTDHVVQYTLDHSRLLVSSLDSKAFHTHQGRYSGQPQLPTLAALVYPENITEQSDFYQMLRGVANELYSDVKVATVDVRQYHHWTNLIVPKHYNIDTAQSGDKMWLYMYPRICIIEDDDHNHAAFYPNISHLPTLQDNFIYDKPGLMKFVQLYLKSPEKLLVETELF